MIYLLDTLGNECGMNLYNAAFRNKLQSKGQDVTTISNYNDESVLPLIRNFYHGSKPTKIGKLLISWMKVWGFYLRHRQTGNYYIYQSIGLRIIDICFILMFAGRRQFAVVAHDLFEITGKHCDDRHKKFKIWFYNHFIKAIICHSEDTMTKLDQIGYKGRKVYYPHFSYDFDKEVHIEQVAADIQSAVNPGKKNFLFFGQLRDTKGIEILKEAILILQNRYAEQTQGLNIIIAGHDKAGYMQDFATPDFLQTRTRYINDNELNFLFKACDHILLPYKEVYQSGVLEVVIYFRKAVIMSDVPYFAQIKQKYPSFGHLYSPNTPEALANAILSHCQSDNSCYFTEADLCKYNEEHNPDRLIAFICSL